VVDDDDTESVPDFEFFLISEQEGFGSYMDGILGMSRYGYNTGQNERYYMNQLKEEGHITADLFAFYIHEATSDSPSYLDIGSYSTDRMYGGSADNINWFAMADDFYWKFESADAIIFEDADGDTKGYKTDDYYVIFDSGTSYNKVPDEISNAFFSYLLDDVDYSTETDGDRLYCACDEEHLRTIHLRLDGKYVEIKPADYLDLMNEAENLCFIGWEENDEDEDHWMLGGAFYRGYYVIHDDDNDRLGLIAQADLEINDDPEDDDPNIIEAGDLPSNTMPYDSSSSSDTDEGDEYTTLYWIAGMLGGTILFSIIYYVFEEFVCVKTAYKSKAYKKAY
jgi:hypothetical protein